MGMNKDTCNLKKVHVHVFYISIFNAKNIVKQRNFSLLKLK